jgi:hypothetical protein
LFAKEAQLSAGGAVAWPCPEEYPYKNNFFTAEVVAEIARPFWRFHIVTKNLYGERIDAYLVLDARDGTSICDTFPLAKPGDPARSGQ